jgi:hypothetical protein
VLNLTSAAAPFRRRPFLFLKKKPGRNGEIQMHCVWRVTIIRLNGKPDLEYTLVRGRAPTPGEVLEWRGDDETVRGKIGSWHHVPPKDQGSNLGTYEIRASEIAS